jgi:hypothetical protein
LLEQPPSTPPEAANAMKRASSIDGAAAVGTPVTSMTASVDMPGFLDLPKTRDRRRTGPIHRRSAVVERPEVSWGPTIQIAHVCTRGVGWCWMALVPSGKSFLLQPSTVWNKAEYALLSGVLGPGRQRADLRQLRRQCDGDLSHAR